MDGGKAGGKEREGEGTRRKRRRRRREGGGGGLGKDGENDVVGRAMSTAAGQPSVHKRRRKGWLGIG
jgi:hypothetical protein